MALAEGHFCIQYLLQNNCTRHDACLFLHVKKGDVQLYEPIPNGSDFVKGLFIRRPAECVYTQQIQPRDKGENKCFCQVNSSRHTCVHSGEQTWENMEPLNAMPSTSTISASSQNAAESDDESCLGATALSPVPTVPVVPTQYKKSSSKSMNRRNKLNIDAPEFMPRTRFNTTVNSKKRLCPYAERNGLCKYPPGECTYLHGDMCDLCARPALHPHNEDLRKKHTQECIKRHERDMEMAFAMARSKEKICGICFEVIMQKNTYEQRFGILPSCNHCFCLACIRRWRQSKQFENKIIRSCPECRIPSDFVCPSPYWVDTKEDKDKVIEKYKLALSKKDCKYFKHGRGHCPFGNKCFYRHCLHNGKKVDVGPPPSTNSSSHSNDFLELPAGVEIIQRLLMLERLQEFCPLNDFLDEMELGYEIMQMLDTSEMFFSDTDESYWSD